MRKKSWTTWRWMWLAGVALALGYEAQAEPAAAPATAQAVTPTVAPATLSTASLDQIKAQENALREGLMAEADSALASAKAQIAVATKAHDPEALREARDKLVMAERTYKEASRARPEVMQHLSDAQMQLIKVYLYIAEALEYQADQLAAAKQYDAAIAKYREAMLACPDLAPELRKKSATVQSAQNKAKFDAAVKAVDHP